MKNECSVVKDLLPLYFEGIVSEDTAESVREHLFGCPVCSAEFAAFQEQKIPVMDAESEALPLKAVKRKFRAKRIAAALLGMLASIVVFLVALSVRSAVIDYGYSEKYDQSDMDAAIAMIKEEFDSWEGCKLYSISYTDDGLCQRELDYCNSLAAEGEIYDACIVFRMQFRSPLFGGGAWNANSVYNWSWYLARTGNGPWELLTWGAP